MAWENSTPAWWRSSPLVVQVVLLVVFLPGLLAHELTHMVAGAIWTDVDLVLDDVAVDIHWEDAEAPPWWAPVFVNLSPFLFGVGVAYAAALGVYVTGSVVSMSLPVLAYVLIQWFVYTLAVLGDLNWTPGIPDRDAA